MKKAQNPLRPLPKVHFKASSTSSSTYPVDQKALKMPSPSISRQFWPIVKLLHWFGSCPVGLLSKNQRSPHLVYEWRLLKPSTLLPFLFALVFVLIWLKYMMELSFRLAFTGSSFIKSKEYFFAFTKDFGMRSNASTNYTSEPDPSIASVPNVSRFLFSIVPLAAITRTIVSWVDAGKFVEFINNWQYIEHEFENVFLNRQLCGDKNLLQPDSSKTFVDLTHWRNKFLMFYVAIPSLLCVPVYMGGNVHFDEVMEALLVGACSLHFIVFPLVDDTRTCFAHRVIAEAFYQTKIQIQRCIKSGRLEFQTVSAWREFIDLVRCQCSLWGQVESKNQLSATAMAIASTTAVVFIIVHGDYEKQRSFNVILILASYALFQFLQLASKSSTAELITARENEIAKLMVNIKADATDAITFVEVKFIHDMILLAPSRVLLGSCVMLNKGLMISVYSQVATYIVVLLQLKKQ